MDLHTTGYRTYEGTYRGKAVKIRGHQQDDGFRRVKRWWSYEAGDRGETYIKDFETAKMLARRSIDIEIDGDPWERWRRKFFSAEPLVVAEPDRKSELRQKLMQMTTARGCSEAEAATARRKLQELDDDDPA